VTESYILGDHDHEIKRLETQAKLFEPLTRQALLTAGLKKGMSCADIGCGSGSVSRLIAEIVGITGRVLGVDVDDKYLQYCRTVSTQTNMEFVHDNICESRLNEKESFDIVYSRFVFHHLSDTKKAARSMIQLVKRGGAIVIQELDHAPGSWLSYPESKAFNSLREVYVALIKKTGADPLAGRKLYKLLMDESLDTTIECYSPCILMSCEPYSSLGWQLADSLKPRILKHGLQSEKEYANMYKGLKELAKKKGTFVTYARLFSAIGRKRK
jgi:ubiquinone/menaquinone biosynthesis C-methylase UbiE